MQLKKLSDTHYVVVTDEQINFNDYYLSCLSNRVLQRTEKMDIVEVNDKKITHSTQPLEYVMGHDSKGWVSINPIDLSYIKSLVGEVDVDKKAQEFVLEEVREGHPDYKFSPIYESFWVEGYKECLEDNKHKRFTMQDLQNAWIIGYRGDSLYELHEYFEQPKDTWEVYFDTNNNLKLK